MYNSNHLVPVSPTPVFRTFRSRSRAPSPMCCSSWLSLARVLLGSLSLLFLLSGLSLLSVSLWVRFDPHWERALRQTALSDPALAPPELADTKLEFRLAYMALFWAVLALSSGLALVGFVGLCAGCSHSRPICVLLVVLLFLLILLQLVAFLGISLFRQQILDRLGTYISVSHQYNLQDATVIRERFRCCGDGNYQQSYNYQCQGLDQPNCRQLLEQWLARVLLGMAIFVAGTVLAELFGIVLAGVLICNRKYSAMDAAR